MKGKRLCFLHALGTKNFLPSDLGVILYLIYCHDLFFTDNLLLLTYIREFYS